MHFNTIAGVTRKTMTIAISLLLAAMMLMAVAGPASALQPTGPNGGNDPLPHNQPPLAAFTISPNPALVSNQILTAPVQAHLIPGGNVGNINALQTGDVVTFDGSASTDDHKILNYEWDLDGNGTFETHGVLAKIEKKRFFTAGSYTIKLRVTDAQGLNDVVSHVLTVRNAPQAKIAANVAVPLVGQQVTYSAAGSTGDPAIASYQWDLDGNGTFETNTGTTPSATTAYQSAGTRAVEVKVTDTLGHSAIASLQEIVNQAPIAAFTDAPSPAFVGETVKFDGSSSSDDDPIADYAWDLDGNGTFETDTHGSPLATKKYTTPGTINVRLRVTDDHGVQNIVTHPVVVNPAPTTGTGSTTNTTNNPGPKVNITPKVVKVSKKGTVTLHVSCPKAERECTGVLTLRRGAHASKAGAGQFLAGGGQTAFVRVHLSRATLKLIKRHHPLKVKASAVARDLDGNAATSTATITVKR
jgi:hypothetical protein